jgi:ubiquinone/menaquinone biosynthesis C-methylase UbiE
MINSETITTTHVAAAHFCNLVLAEIECGKQPRVLVAGCGTAHEALYIFETLRGWTTGIDIEQHWDSDTATSHPNFNLLQGSLLNLPFESKSFDFVFYHHVIEHVSDPRKSLSEISRVLVNKGLLYVGTPNRHRLIGYLGGFNVSTKQKLLWNLTDYRHRVLRRFENHYGAHAGFSQKEMTKMLSENYSSIQNLTINYFQYKYGRQIPKSFHKVIEKTFLKEVLPASVYFTARSN